MGKKILKKVAEEAFLAVLMLVAFAATVFGGFALLDVFNDPSEKAATTGVYSVTTPTETTTAVEPTPPPAAESPASVPAPVVADEPVATEPSPETTPAVEPELPEGWEPPSVPGGPPTAPMPPPYEVPCLPGEGGDRCAPDAG